MANLTVRFFSECLKRYTTFLMYLPNDHEDSSKKPMKTLFLLHGYTGDAGNWVPEHIAEKYNFAIVIPNGENAFWVDGISTGHRYGSFVGEELVNYLRRTFHIAENREDTYIMGLSMGGYGALHTALLYPDTFGKCAGLSSALIIKSKTGMKPEDDDRTANYEYYRECFGDLDKLLESDHNPEVLVKRIKARGKSMPEIFMSCGTEDFLLENNRDFHNFLAAENVPHHYYESKGGHDMTFWSEYAEKFCDMMFS